MLTLLKTNLFGFQRLMKTPNMMKKISFTTLAHPLLQNTGSQHYANHVFTFKTKQISGAQKVDKRAQH